MSENSAERMTRQLIRRAGITNGTRVLEVGCGHGRVTDQLSEAVGFEGEVVAMDIDEDSLKAASKNLEEANRTNVTFLNSDVDKLSGVETFDAIFARRVFMYLPNPRATIEKLGLHLRPNGVLAIQEHDASFPVCSGAAMPIHEKYRDLIWETVRREGADTQLGPKLWSYLNNSGLEVVDLRAEAVLQTPSSPYPYASIVRAIQHRIVANGVSTKESLELDTIESRLSKEREETKTTFVSEMSYCILSQKS